jgi:hypothetical protein
MEGSVETFSKLLKKSTVGCDQKRVRLFGHYLREVIRSHRHQDSTWLLLQYSSRCVGWYMVKGLHYFLSVSWEAYNISWDYFHNSGRCESLNSHLEYCWYWAGSKESMRVSPALMTLLFLMTLNDAFEENAENY